MCWKNTCASIWGRRVARWRSASEIWWRSPVSSGGTCVDKHLAHLRQRDFLSGVFADLPPAHYELTGRKNSHECRKSRGPRETHVSCHVIPAARPTIPHSRKVIPKHLSYLSVFILNNAASEYQFPIGFRRYWD